MLTPFVIFHKVDQEDRIHIHPYQASLPLPIPHRLPSSNLRMSTPKADEKAVLTTCHNFLDGIKNRDSKSMHAIILPNGQATLIRPPVPGSSVRQLLQITLPACIDRIPFDHPEEIEETIALAAWEDGEDDDRYGGRQTEVKVDMDFAVVWTPFVVYIGGKVSHRGTNVFQLTKRIEGEKKGEWVITGLADTARA